MPLMNLSCGEIFLSSLLKILINKPSVHSKDSENDNYVSIVAKKDEFDFLIKYSPLHTIKEVKYPAMMVTTGDHDDRVVPAHTYKYVAML